MGLENQESLFNNKLVYLLDTLNNQELRTIFFVYLHDFVNRYSSEESQLSSE